MNRAYILAPFLILYGCAAQENDSLRRSNSALSSQVVEYRNEADLYRACAQVLQGEHVPSEEGESLEAFCKRITKHDKPRLRDVDTDTLVEALGQVLSGL